MTTVDTDRVERAIGAIREGRILDPTDDIESPGKVKCPARHDDDDDEQERRRSVQPPIPLSLYDPRFRLTESVPEEAGDESTLHQPSCTPPSLPETAEDLAEAATTTIDMEPESTPSFSLDSIHRDATSHVDLSDPSSVATESQIKRSRFLRRKKSKLRDRAVYSSRIMMQRYWKYALLTIASLSVLLLAAIIVIIFLALHRRSGGADATKDKNGPDYSNIGETTIDLIRSRGYLVCGVVEYPGLSKQDESSGDWSGFEIDLVSEFTH